MPTERMIMRKLREILRLKLDYGLKHRQIERAVGVSIGAVSKYCRLAEQAGLSWPMLDRLDDTEIERLLQPAAQAGAPTLRIEPDYAQVHRELKRKGVTLTLLWEEYRGEHPGEICLGLATIVPAVEPGRRDPDHVEEAESPHQQNGPDGALPLPLPGRRRHAEAQGGQLPAALEAPAELDVFHQRHVRIAAQSFKGLSTDEDGLVARRDAAPAGALVHEPGDHPEHAPRVVEADVEAPRDDAGIAGRGFHGGEGAVGQERVGVEEEQDVAARRARARVHLARAPAGAREQANLRRARRDGGRRVRAAAIHQDDLGAGEARHEIGQQAFEVGRLVEGGDDDADQKARRRRSLTSSAQCR